MTYRSQARPISVLFVGSLVSLACLASLSLLAGACSPVTDGGPAEGRSSSSVLVVSRVDPAVLSDPAQRALSRRLALAPLSAGPGPGAGSGELRLGAPGEAVAKTDPGRALLTLLVACALPADVSLTGTATDGSALSFLGGVGLAPRWLEEPLTPEGRAWVSACAIAQVSGTALAVPISLRGPRLVLAASADEQEAWSLEEGAFFGDAFAGLVDAPMPWFACRGVGAISDPALADRVCTEEDPARPGVTRCGMIFAGDCAAICRRRGGHYARCLIPGRDDAATGRVVTAFLIP